MNQDRFKAQHKYLFIVLATILLFYVVLRGYLLSFTHDESLSFTITQGDNSWANTANNHLLNTILMSGSQTFFGMSEFSLRLPNVLAFLLYSYGSYLIFKSSKKIWISVLAFTIILLNPFLIEFFSLARGYGLSMGFMIMSIHFTIRNKLEYTDAKLLLIDFGFSVLFVSLAIYSSLALINYYICVLIVFLCKYYKFRKSNYHPPKFHLKFGGVFLVSILPLFLGVKRLLKLRDGGQLYYGAIDFTEGLEALIQASASSSEYLPVIMIIIKAVLISFTVIGILFVLIKQVYNSELFLIMLVMLLLFAGLFTEDIFFDAKYPMSRTALYYIPIISIFIYQLFTEITEQYKIKTKYNLPVVLVMIAPVIINFIFSLNLTYTDTWKYDAHTKDAMKLIRLQTENAKRKYTLSTHWMLEPTSNYYIIYWDLNLEPVKRTGVTLGIDFIYRMDDATQLDNYTVLSSYPDINSELLKKDKREDE